MKVGTYRCRDKDSTVSGRPTKFGTMFVLLSMTMTTMVMMMIVFVSLTDTASFAFSPMDIPTNSRLSTTSSGSDGFGGGRNKYSIGDDDNKNNYYYNYKKVTTNPSAPPRRSTLLKVGMTFPVPNLPEISEDDAWKVAGTTTTSTTVHEWSTIQSMSVQTLDDKTITFGELVSTIMERKRTMVMAKTANGEKEATTVTTTAPSFFTLTCLSHFGDIRAKKLVQEYVLKSSIDDSSNAR